MCMYIFTPSTPTCLGTLGPCLDLIARVCLLCTYMYKYRMACIIHVPNATFKDPENSSYKWCMCECKER